jgi:hypothetical protein
MARMGLAGHGISIGRRNRSGPTGAWAKGMPRKLEPVGRLRPDTVCPQGSVTFTNGRSATTPEARTRATKIIIIFFFFLVFLAFHSLFALLMTAKSLAKRVWQMAESLFWSVVRQRRRASSLSLAFSAAWRSASVSLSSRCTCGVSLG